MIKDLKNNTSQIISLLLLFALGALTGDLIALQHKTNPIYPLSLMLISNVPLWDPALSSEEMVKRDVLKTVRITIHSLTIVTMTSMLVVRTMV